MSFVELETDSRASPGAVLAGRTATGRVSAQQSHPIWQTNRFRCSNPDPRGSQTSFGAVIASDRGLESPLWPFGCQNDGARLLFPLFLQRNTQANPALAGDGGAWAAPKPVSLPMRLSKLHRNAFFCHWVCPHCTETRLVAARDGSPGVLPAPGHATGRTPAPALGPAPPARLALGPPPTPPPVPTFSISRKFVPCARVRPYSSGLRRGDKGICASETP